MWLGVPSPQGHSDADLIDGICQRPCQLEIAELFLAGPHLGVHVEPGLQRREVGQVGLGEARVVVLLDGSSVPYTATNAGAR
jgi:hypothetical protein